MQAGRRLGCVREVAMKKGIVLLALLMAGQSFALDKSLISVKDAAVSNGVVLVSVRESGKSYELQCNQNAPNCNVPKPGDYWLVRLPKNYGLYDCANVDLYLQSADPEQHDQVFGEYCSNEK